MSPAELGEWERSLATMATGDLEVVLRLLRRELHRREEAGR